MHLRWIVTAVLLCLLACSSGPQAGPGERVVALPDGTKIVAAVMSRPDDMARGMMFRDSLPADRGMLFIHDRPGRHPYWMHNCKIPLDIVWLDPAQRVVEISANTPPCQKQPSDCPAYGGRKDSIFVLELAAGLAAKYKIAEGAALNF